LFFYLITSSCMAVLFSTDWWGGRYCLVGKKCQIITQFTFQGFQSSNEASKDKCKRIFTPNVNATIKMKVMSKFETDQLRKKAKMKMLSYWVIMMTVKVPDRFKSLRRWNEKFEKRCDWSFTAIYQVGYNSIDTSRHARSFVIAK